MFGGTTYGVILNDRRQLDAMRAEFGAAPYGRPPKAPVLYIKPRGCVTLRGAPVRLPASIAEVEIAATIGLLFGRDATKVAAEDVCGVVAAACLALEVSVPRASFFRPAIVERCRDGFLPLGPLGSFSPALDRLEIETLIDGAEAHRWSFESLDRDISTLVADVSSFMTLAAGDMLLVGLPGDAPRVGPGHSVSLRSSMLPALTVQVELEEGA